MPLTGRTLLAVCLFLSLALTGCETMQAQPSKGAGFVPMDEMAPRADLPFQKVWIKAGVDWDKYHKLYIEQPNTDYLIKGNAWQEHFRKDKIQQDMKTIADYMGNAFAKAFKDDPKKRYEIIDKPEPGSLTAEVALTELTPSNPVLEALGIAGPYGSGVVVQAAAKETGARATVAFEAKILDSESGEVLAMFADREQGKFAPINLRGLTWYGECQASIDDWSKEFVEVANKRPDEVVKPSSPFTLSPW